MGKNSILFIFEGEVAEKKLFKKIEKYFKELNLFTNANIITINGNIYSLYNRIKKEYKDNYEYIDIFEYLKNDVNYRKQIDHRIKRDDISEIYLFFDFDPQDKGYDKKIISSMLEFFNNETEKGKLYINYPMLESFYHIISKNHDVYRDQVISFEKCKQYKKIVNDEALIDFKQTKIDINGINFIFDLNIKKLNYLISDKFKKPLFKDLPKLSQDKLFITEKNKYFEKEQISIINSIPAFIAEYVNEKMYDRIFNNQIKSSDL